MTGKDVVYCCADDTHGTPIELKANELKIKPEELIAKVFKEHTRDFKNFLIKFDSYHTTNSKENKHFSDLIFNRLKDKGHIYTKKIEVTYCEHDKRTLPDRYVKGRCPKCNAPDQYGDVCESCNAAYKTIDLIEPYCILCKKKPVKKDSVHYFFRLSSFSDFLERWLRENKNLQPEVRNFVLNWIKSGLEDWDVSRDGPYFGFNIPGEKDKYYYVWLDAPIGYIASYANLIGDIKKTEKQWNDSQIIHFIGKDIIYFHLLFWPAMLEGADFALPQDIVVHGFLTVNGEKMSKSRGTFFTAQDFLGKYNPEYLRYYYASMLSKKLADINLDFRVFRDKINNELVANIGNFCYRVISFVNKNFDGKISKKAKGRKYPIQSVSHESVSDNYRALNFNEVVRSILLISAHGNQVFQQEEPWKNIKTDKESVEALCYFCLDLVKNLSILISPILPELSKEIQSQLGLKELSWGDLDRQFDKYNLEKEKILVQKLEDAENPVFPLNLKVAKIIEIKEHPDAEKLYVLQIDLGKEKRQLVAGLRQHYSIDELKNKKIIVITNLKFAKLRGIESQGMLLAGDDGNEVGVLTTKAEPGTQAGIEDFDNSNEQLSFEQFQKLSLVVKNGHPTFENREIKAGSETIKVEKVKDGARIK